MARVYYSVAKANDSLVLVRRIADALLANRITLDRFLRVDADNSRPLGEYSEAAQKLIELRKRERELEGELQGLGLEYNISAGYHMHVRFPTLVNGNEALLYWQKGADSISHGEVLRSHVLIPATEIPDDPVRLPYVRHAPHRQEQ